MQRLEVELAEPTLNVMDIDGKHGRDVVLDRCAYDDLAWSFEHDRASRQSRCPLANGSITLP
jgi:hypothetical protein